MITFLNRKHTGNPPEPPRGAAIDQLRDHTTLVAGARARAAAPPIALLGVPFDNVTLEEALQRIVAMIESRRPHYVVTANVDFLVQARRDADLRRILMDSHMAICDGMPLVWASKLLGNPLPERVAGADLVPRLIRIAAERRYRLFFLGASETANQRAVANLRAKYPELVVAGHYSPPFRPLPEMNNAEIIRRVREARPDVVLVAFGCPKAEKWIARHFQTLGVPVMIGVGATIDFLAGRMKRAPAWMQIAGVEWLFRLCQEPKRLFGRYLADFWGFVGALSQQWWQTRLKVNSAAARHSVVTAAGKWTRIQVPEQLDRRSVRLGEWIWQRATQAHCLLDLRVTRRIDSTGLGLLLRLRKELGKTGKDFVLLAPNPEVIELLKSLRLYDHFMTADDMAEFIPSTGSDPEEIGATMLKTERHVPLDNWTEIANKAFLPERHPIEHEAAAANTHSG